MQIGNRKTARRLARGAAGAGLLLALLALALPGQARRGHGDGGFGPADFMLRHAQEIGLDEATRAEIEAIVAASREQGEALRAEREGAHATLRELLLQDEPDPDAVMKQAETLGEIDLRARQQRLATLLAVRAKLTPEQRAALEQRKQEMREQHGKQGRHGHHRGTGGCRDEAGPPDAREAL